MKKFNKKQIEFDKNMEKLAEKTGLTYDSGSDDNRLFYDNGMITVYAHLMSEKKYDQMESQIEKTVINRKHYTVASWNDVSGYEYWNEGGKSGDSNYIQVTAYIKNPEKIKPEQLKKDVLKVFNKLSCYNNVDEYYFSSLKKGS